MAKKQEIIELKPIVPKVFTVTIEGDSDLVLNKTDAPTERQLTAQREGRAKDMGEVNPWEKIITSIHWRDGVPKEFSEESMQEALKNNAPCISAHGLKMSLADAVVRSGVDKYSTKFKANVNIMGSGLIPVEFTEHYIHKQLMSPKKGSPILVNLNCFKGWRASFRIACLENIYTVEQIVNLIGLAGFGLGIGSSRGAGFGRYHVSGVQ